MQFGEIRSVIKSHFSKALALRKDRISTTGRLLPEDISALQGTRGFADQALTDDRFPSEVLDRDDVAMFIAKRALPIELDGPAFRSLAMEYQRGLRDYAEGILRFDASLERIELEEESSSVPHQPTSFSVD